ncbi:hypothetical protein SASC598J21_000130, partial [Snodgrassella alvi SCGC AB-598-J21]
QVTFDNFAYYFVSMRNFNRVQKYKLKKIVMEKIYIALLNCFSGRLSKYCF